MVNPNPRDTIVLTDDVVAVVAGNPGLDISITDLTTAKLKGGCIRYMRYGDSAQDLDMVVFDNGDKITDAEVGNLKDFRENFECAAKEGMGVTFCVIGKRISMVNLYPCLCTCSSSSGIGKGRPASYFLPLSGS